MACHGPCTNIGVISLLETNTRDSQQLANTSDHQTGFINGGSPKQHRKDDLVRNHVDHFRGIRYTCIRSKWTHPCWPHILPLPCRIMQGNVGGHQRRNALTIHCNPPLLHQVVWMGMVLLAHSCLVTTQQSGFKVLAAGINDQNSTCGWLSYWYGCDLLGLDADDEIISYRWTRTLGRDQVG